MNYIYNEIVLKCDRFVLRISVSVNDRGKKLNIVLGQIRACAKKILELHNYYLTYTVE